jgi:hypothetical protein
MSSNTYVGRLKELGKKLLELPEGCKKETGKFQQDCEKVALKFMAPVSEILKTKFSDAIRNFLLSSESDNQLMYEQGEFTKISNNLNLKFGTHVSIEDVKKNMEKNKENLENLYLNPDKKDACFRLVDLLYIDKSGKNKYNLDKTFNEEILKLFTKIQISENVESIDNQDKDTKIRGIQYGGFLPVLGVIGLIVIIVFVIVHFDQKADDEKKNKRLEDLENKNKPEEFPTPETTVEWTERKYMEMKKNIKDKRDEYYKRHKKWKQWGKMYKEKMFYDDNDNEQNKDKKEFQKLKRKIQEKYDREKRKPENTKIFEFLERLMEEYRLYMNSVQQCLDKEDLVCWEGVNKLIKEFYSKISERYNKEFKIPEALRASDPFIVFTPHFILYSHYFESGKLESNYDFLKRSRITILNKIVEEKKKNKEEEEGQSSSI